MEKNKSIDGLVTRRSKTTASSVKATPKPTKKTIKVTSSTNPTSKTRSVSTTKASGASRPVTKRTVSRPTTKRPVTKSSKFVGSLVEDDIYKNYSITKSPKLENYVNKIEKNRLEIIKKKKESLK